MGQNKTTAVANLFLTSSLLTTIVVRVLVLSASALYWIFFFTDLEYYGGGSFLCDGWTPNSGYVSSRSGIYILLRHQFEGGLLHI